MMLRLRIGQRTRKRTGSGSVKLRFSNLCGSAVLPRNTNSSGKARKAARPSTGGARPRLPQPFRWRTIMASD